MIDEAEGCEPVLDPLDRAVLAAAREMTSEGTLGDATYAALSQRLSKEHLLDLIITIAFYNGVKN